MVYNFQPLLEVQVQLVIYANISHVSRISGKVQICHAHSPNSHMKVNTEVTASRCLPCGFLK